jgi:hypothetical protein
MHDISDLLFIFLHEVRSSLLFIRLSAENLFVHQPLSRLPLILGQVAGLIKHSYYFKPISNNYNDFYNSSTAPDSVYIAEISCKTVLLYLRRI